MLCGLGELALRRAPKGHSRADGNPMDAGSQAPLRNAGQIAERKASQGAAATIVTFHQSINTSLSHLASLTLVYSHRGAHA